MLSLRTALLLILAGGATTAYAEQITCESHQSQTEACGTLQPGGSVRLVQQLSNAPCVEGQNWGIRTSPNHDAIWVSGGWSPLEVLGRWRAGLGRGDVGYRARLPTGAEVNLVRERLGRWYSDTEIAR